MTTKLNSIIKKIKIRKVEVKNMIKFSKLKRVTSGLLLVTVISLTGCAGSMKDNSGNVYAEYKGLEYTKTDTKVTDEDVEKSVESQLEQVKESMAEYKHLKTGKVKTGDTINISYSGKVNGKEVDECKKEDVTFEVGVDDTVFKGFSSAVTGNKPGDKVVTTVKLDNDFSDSNKNINGKDCTFSIKINYIQGEKKVPELTDKLVNKLTDGEYTTLKDYKSELTKEIKKQLKSNKEEEAMYTNEKELLNAIRVNSKFKKVDNKLVKKYKSDYEQYYKDQASSYSMELKDFIEQALQTTEEKFNKERDKQAKIAAEEEMIINFIASKEKLELTDKEYNNYIEELKSKYGYEDIDDLKSDVKEYELEDSIRFTAKKEKVISYLKSKGKEVDKLSKDYSDLDGTAEPESTDSVASTDDTSTEKPESTKK